MARLDLLKNVNANPKRRRALFVTVLYIRVRFSDQASDLAAGRGELCRDRDDRLARLHSPFGREPH